MNWWVISKMDGFSVKWVDYLENGWIINKVGGLVMKWVNYLCIWVDTRLTK